MSRIIIYREQAEEDWNEPKVLEGWFDPEKATRYDADRRFDGNNMVSVITGSQWVDEYLYRTAGGRWVLNNDATRSHNGPDTYRFITDDEAREWLIRSECNDKAVEEFFGEIEEERGPGRPEIGKPVPIRLGDQLPRVDAHRQRTGQTRADLVRDLVKKALDDIEADLKLRFDVEAGLREIVGDDYTPRQSEEASA